MQKNSSAILSNRIMKKMIKVVVPGIALLFFLSISTAIGGSLDITGGNSGSHDVLIPPLTGPHDLLADHPAHWSFMTGAPPTGAVTNVNYFIDSHAGADALSAAQIADIQAAAGIWNAAGANVSLTQVGTNAAADMHLHGDSISGCGITAIGCAEFSYFLGHSGVYGDADPHHMMASQLIGGIQEITMLTLPNWFSGVAGGIGGGQFDFLTVAIQEFGHLLGLGHNSGASAHGDSANSPMNGSLPTGTTRRILQPTDLTAIQHLYGAAAVAVPEPSTLLLLITGFGAMAFFRRR